MTADYVSFTAVSMAIILAVLTIMLVYLIVASLIRRVTKKPEIICSIHPRFLQKPGEKDTPPSEILHLKARLTQHGMSLKK